MVEQGKGAGEIGRGEVRNVSEVRIVQPLTERTELTEIAASISNADDPVALDIETYGENALNGCIRSTVNCTRKGRCTLRFQPL